MASTVLAGRFALRLVVVAATLLAASCSSNPVTKVAGAIAGSGKDKKEDNAPKEEDRISILALEQTLEADPRYAGAEVKLPPAYRNPAWPQPGGEADHTLHHLNAAGTFKEVWKTKIGEAGQRAVLTSPPVAADGIIYVMDARADISAYKMETGERVWRTKMTPDIDERFRLREFLSRPDPAEIGFGGGVALDAGKLIVTSGFGFIAALNAETGEEIWKTKTEAPIRTPPTAYRGAVYAITNTNKMVVLDEETGEQKWNFQSFEESARILSSASPAAAGDLVVAPFSSGEVVALLADSGKALWNDTLTRNANLTALASLNDIAGSPVIDRGLVYVVSHAGRFTAIDIRSGQPVWEVPLASLQMPWVAGDYIFIVSVDAELVCISRNDGAIVWISKLRRYEKEKKRKNRISWAGPVLAGDGLILVSTHGEIVKVSPQTGEVMETKKIGDGFIVPPIVADEMVFVLSEEGKLIALR